MRRGWVKCICAFFCVIFLNVGIWGSVLSFLWYSNVPTEQNFYESNFCHRETNENFNLLWEIVELHEYGENENYSQQRIGQIREKLAENNNFRYRISCPDGSVYSNIPASTMRNQVYRVYEYDPSYYHDGAEVTYYIRYGVLAPLEAEDEYAQAQNALEWINANKFVVPGISIACVVLGLFLLILLFCGAGRRVGREEVVLNWHDKIPYDLYLAVQVLLNCLCWGLALLEGIYYLSWAEDWAGVAWVGGAGLGGSILVLAVLLTTATRIKARTIFRNTIIWRLCAWLWRLVKKLWVAVKRCGSALNRAIHTLPMVWRIVVLFVVYLTVALLTTILFIVGVIWFSYNGWATLLTLLMIVAIPAWHGVALYLLCRWALQWRTIRGATQSVVAGQTDVQINTEKFYSDLKEHAEQLNGLGLAIDNAVGERMKSERFKSELITNVSHDLKTPLTSIINYVDLLKKEEIENPTAQEYIEVLDRKSQRLKKLTEDLVEASKASTGALTVNKERLDLVQLIRQALGEYEEKLSNAELTLMTTLPEQELYINGDGRHVWRVLDNLLGNCAKYAMEGTRVYLDLIPWDGKAVITVKNISRNPLNIPAEQLVERFVRGDESRTTEGSGLGLSIARSLTELQGGQFLLDIDGDLFKAKVLLPLAE